MAKCPDCGVVWEKTTKAKNNRCRVCRPIYDKAWRARRKAEGRPVLSTKMPREYHAAYERSYYARPEVKAHRAKQMREYTDDPKRRPRHEARWKVRREIEAGRLQPKPCEVCGAEKVDGHHDDYSKPLSVRWLCRKHHAEHHRNAKAGA